MPHPCRGQSFKFRANRFTMQRENLTKGSHSRRVDRSHHKSKYPDEEGIRICIEQIKELKEMKGIHGIHLMGMDLEEKFAQIVDRAGLSPRPKIE